jgi:putative membrane protein
MKTKLRELAVFAFALCAPALAGAQQEQYWPGPWHMWSGGWGFWWIFPLLMCLFMIAVFAGVFLLMHRAGGHASHGWMPGHMTGPWGDPTHSALQILNERFAKGEIQKQEYEDKKAAILSGGPR